MAAGQDLCPEIQQLVPSFCTHSANCNVIKCGVSISSYFSGDVEITLDPCKSSPSLSLQVDLNKPVSIGWSDTWGTPTEVKVCARGVFRGWGSESYGGK
jgi:hypothetical protein